MRCLSAYRNPLDSLQKATTRSIYSMHVCSWCFSVWGHLLIISLHSITADISTLIFATSPFLCSPLRSTRDEHCFFAVALSWCSSPHLPVLQPGSLHLSVTGNLFLPDHPLPPPLSESRRADKTGEPRKEISKQLDRATAVTSSCFCLSTSSYYIGFSFLFFCYFLFGLFPSDLWIFYSIQWVTLKWPDSRCEHVSPDLWTPSSQKKPNNQGDHPTWTLAKQLFFMSSLIWSPKPNPAGFYLCC